MAMSSNPKQPVLVSADWPAPDNIVALTTTRIGGVSLPPHDEFNLGLHVDDDPEAVQSNRSRLRAALDCPEPAWLDQTHSNRVIDLAQSDCSNFAAQPIAADGAFTSKANQVCAVLTADCLPVLLCSTDGEWVSAVHAGWRGLHDGILEHALAGYRGEDRLIAWLGPAISQAHYQVDGAFEQRFVARDSDFAKAFEPDGDEHFRCSLKLIASIILERNGVTVYGGQHCTYQSPEQFYSYRRSPNTGRIASLIFRRT